MSTNPDAGTAQAWADHRVVLFPNGQHDSLCALTAEEGKLQGDARKAAKEAARQRAAESGECYKNLSLGDLFDFGVQNKPKLEGASFIPSSYDLWDAREHKAQQVNGSYVALTADIDSGDHAPKAVQQAVAAFVGDAAYLIYSSPHSRPGDRRWRVVVPLANPAPFEAWHDAQTAFFAWFASRGIATDAALSRAAQTVYLPNVPQTHAKTGEALRGDDGAPLHYQRCATSLKKPGLDLGQGLVADGMAEIARKRAADEREREQMRAEAMQRRANRPQGDETNIIEAFNAGTSVETMLELCGYERSPRDARDWRSPHQTGQTYATRVMDDGTWFSLSQSDTDARLGQPCRQGCFGDAYDLEVHYKHGGDHKAAWRAIGAELRGNVIRPTRFNPPDWMSEIPMPDEAPEVADFDTYEGVELDEEALALRAGIMEPEGIEERWPEPVDLWARFEEPELPGALLPLTVDMFARRQAAIMGADPAGMAMAALTVCATAIPDSIELQVKRNDPTWREHARLWVALVGPPSRKKTPIFKAAMGPLRALDNKLMRAYLQACEEYEDLPKEDKKSAQKPRQRRLIISDATIEAAQEVAMDSPDGFMSEQDELSGWFGSMDRYNTKGGGDRAFWLKAFNGGTYNLNRIGRGAKQIPNLSISLLGGIQPEPMRKFAADSVDDGLLQRMLPVILRPSTVGLDAAQDATAEDYSALVADLYALRNQGHTLLHFSDAARTIRDRLEREHLDLSNALETISPKLAAHYGKYDGIFARLCIVFHCIDNAYRELPQEISEDTARRVAAFMADFIRPSAIAFYAGVLGMSAGHEDLVSLASVIVAKGLDEVGARDAQRSGQTLRHVTAEQFRTIAEKLEAFGWLERGEPKAKSNTTRWIVNPRVHSLFAERAQHETERRRVALEALRGAIENR